MCIITCRCINHIEGQASSWIIIIIIKMCSLSHKIDLSMETIPKISKHEKKRSQGMKERRL